MLYKIGKKVDTFVTEVISNVFIWSLSLFSKHGTKIRTGITRKRVTCYMRYSACSWCIVKNAKIFWSYVEQFWIFQRERNCRILIVYAIKFSWITFLTEKTKNESSASFFFLFFELLWENNKFQLKTYDRFSRFNFSAL